MAYDVFISYRRLSKGVNGVHIARSLQQELKSMGLNVFFDMEELTDGKFNEKLYDAIESSKNVIFLMTEGSLDRCVNEGDWVRNELEHVIETGINLVPVAPTGTTIAFPEGFPEKLEPMRMLEVSELNLDKLFKESVTKIAGRLKDIVLVTDKERQEAEGAFLNQARRFKDNDGVINAEERKVLEETGKELGISKARQIVLIEKVEQEYSAKGLTAAQDLMPPMPAVVPRFDIFISYRRDGGGADARMMYDRLTKEGYSVSFDLDTLKNGNFNEELLRRVAECKNFIVLLSKGCFDRTLKGCKREDDWMRIELATALFNKKNIVTVMLPGFEFPPKLPPDIDAIRFKNGPKYDLYYLDSFYERLQKDFLQKDASPDDPETAMAEEEVVSVDAKEVTYDESLDDVFGDDSSYWKVEAEAVYSSISRVLVHEELRKIDAAWSEAEENLKDGGDHKLSSRKYMEVIELCGKIKPCSIPFVTRLVGDGIDPHKKGWFKQALAKAQSGDEVYQYGVGMLYADGISVAKDSSSAFRWFERAAQKGHIQSISAIGAAYASGDGVEVDYKAAKRYLTKAEKKGDARAMERLGFLYENGFGVRRSLAIAIFKYQKAAERGNSAAMIALGRMLENGIGMDVDLPKAAAWYRSAVANDSAVAQRKLAEYLFYGKGVDKEPFEAVKLARLSANQGDADAIALLGHAYEEGLGVEADGEKAKELYRKAVDKGSQLGKQYLANLEAEAQYRNGLRSLEGRGVAQDFAEAKAWFEKAAAQGNVAAMEQLGFLCERGLGGEVDIAKAKEWYEKAADKGNAAAMVGLGKMYFRGYDGIEKNYGTALEWFKKAALTWRTVTDENRWKVMYLFFYLGRIYTEGLGIEKNVMIGFRAFLTGANSGNICCARCLALSYANGEFTKKSPEDSKRWYDVCAREEKAIAYADDMAMRVIGQLYQHGDGVGTDQEASRKWYQRSASLGNVQSLYSMGTACRYGRGVKKDIQAALKWYAASAERGYSSAQNSLSWIYYKGEEVERDPQLGFEWALKAARNGSSGAMETLYRMYRDGDGVERNAEEALRWLRSSVDKGNRMAVAKLGKCYEEGLLGVEIDLAHALSLYKEAADKKSLLGMYEYGRCCLYGVGINQDKDAAFKFLGGAMVQNRDDDQFDAWIQATLLCQRLYFESGFKEAEVHWDQIDEELNKAVLRKLGYRLRSGRNIPKNIEQAIICLTAAANRQDKQAQNSLGWMYYKGEVVVRDPKLAFEWTMKAVNNGNPYGMETLFRMYRDGDGVDKDEQEALKWLEVASRNPDEGGVATSELGECYEYGLFGLKKDPSKAFELYYRSSQKNKCPGKFNRGRCHLYGIGTAVDVPRAIEWLSKAAEKEDGDDYKYDLLAMALLVKLYSEGTLVEKDDAKAAEWQSKLDEMKKKRQEEIRGFVSPV